MIDKAKVQLKPCPMCRSEAVMEKEHSNYYNRDVHYAVCDSCDVRGPKELSFERAVEGWNQRTLSEEKLKELIKRLPSMHDQHGQVDPENRADILEQKGVWFTCSYCLGVVHSRSEENPHGGHEDDCAYMLLKKMFGLTVF